MRYYIIAGEASGDLHGSNLIRGILKCDPQAEIRFRGGDKMQEAGGTMAFHYKESAVMGVIEVLMKIGKIAADLKRCKEDVAAFNPDILILIDYPGFNLKMAAWARKKGLKVYYYIAPKLWAHKEWRIRQIRRNVDELFIIFPFEKEYFKKLGVNAHYFGNPLTDSIGRYSFHTVAGGGRTIALLAGSRSMELKWLMPRFVELERLLRSDSRFDGYRLIVAGAPSMNYNDYARHLPSDSKIEIIFGETYSILHQADAAVISSGTASLEAAIIGTPQVVCYGLNPITWQIAKRTVKLKYVSLANLIEDKFIFRELLQGDSSAEKIFAELQRLIFDKEYIGRMKSDYGQLRMHLGEGGASEKIAAKMIELAKQ